MDRFLVRFRFSPDSLTWLVVHGETVLSRHCRKRDAARVASAHARQYRPSTLVIERMDGTAQVRRRYGPVRSGGGARAGGGDGVRT